MNQNLAHNILESILKLVLPDYNSLIGWRDSLVMYVKTHSKATVVTLSTISAHPTYAQMRHFLQKLKPAFNDIKKEDVITAFDNEQKLKKSYRLGGAEGSNKMSVSLCTMVLHLYPNCNSSLHYHHQDGFGIKSLKILLKTRFLMKL